MAIKKISEFVEASSPQNSDKLLIERNGSGKSITVESLAAGIVSSGGDDTNGRWIKFENGYAIWFYRLEVISTGSDWNSWGSYLKGYHARANVSLPISFQNYSIIASPLNSYYSFLVGNTRFDGTTVDIEVYRPTDTVESSISIQFILGIAIIGTWK